MLTAVVAACLVAGPVPAGASTGAPASPAAAAQPAASYQNPAVSGLTANPFVLHSGGTYYAYVSGIDPFGVPMPVYALSSTDLQTWDPVGSVLPPANAGAWTDTSSGTRFSSPSVLELPDNPAAERFVLYFTGTHATTGNKCIGVATASSPTGPFTGAPNPLLCPPGGAQDPSPVTEWTGFGFQQLVYRHNGTNPGIHNHVLTADGQSLNPNHPNPYPLYTSAPSPDLWQQGVVDSPAIAIEGGEVYLFFSGGTPNTAGRAVGWSRCNADWLLIDTCTEQTAFGTWMSGTTAVDSPGGLETFRDAAGHRWLVYDGLPGGSCTATGCSGVRNMRIDKVCVTARGSSGPRTNGPTTTSQPLARPASGDCSADVGGRPFGIAAGSVSDAAAVSQYPPVSFRDGGATTAIGGRTLWVFSDTLMPSGNPPSQSNTAALGAPAAAATGPHWTEDLTPAESARCSNQPCQFIPYTTAEQTWNATHVPCSETSPSDCGRMALWEVGAVTRPDGDAAVFFLKLIDRSWAGCVWCYEFQGIGVARVRQSDLAAGTITADRSLAASPAGCNPDCLLPAAPLYSRPLLDRDHVYLYGDADTPGLARAPVDALDDPDAWEYWTDRPAPNVWSDVPADADPLPGLIDPGQVFDLAAGQVTYNPHLDQYLNVVADQNPAARSDRIMAQVAPEPWGPWTTEELIYDASTARTCDEATPYGALQAPELAMEGGRTVPFTYARPGRDWGRDPTCPGEVRYVTFDLT